MLLLRIFLLYITWDFVAKHLIIVSRRDVTSVAARCKTSRLVFVARAAEADLM